MKRQRRTFLTEFKHDASALVVDQGYTIMQAVLAVCRGNGFKALG